jgi:amino-acid N-acetyltransferase
LSTEVPKNHQVRPATINDVAPIRAIINHYADKGQMLHRSMNELYETIRDFKVATDGAGTVVAVAALHVVWDDLAELKAVAVQDGLQGRGLGRAVVEGALSDAATLGLRRVFTLTYQPEFFAKFGFKIVERNTLPHKVWGECIKCLKFPNCNEVAMICPVR